VAEQHQQDIERERRSAQEQCAVLQTEISRLQSIIDYHSQATAEEVQEAYRKMELTGKELESHKAKRLAARNEMIGIAQALERAHKEGHEMKAFIQYTLAPVVFEQVLTETVTATSTECIVRTLLSLSAYKIIVNCMYGLCIQIFRFLLLSNWCSLLNNRTHSSPTRYALIE
jgi:hypothetical protein